MTFRPTGTQATGVGLDYVASSFESRSMTETAYAATMKAVVGELHPRLKERGFRKRRHTFNREPEPGLIQVVNFQMGPYDVGDPVEIPGLRENLYGKFAVNLGVFLEEIHASLAEFDRPKFVAEYHCEIRKRLGELIADEGEVWWNLEHEPTVLAADVDDALQGSGFPWLDSLASRDAILQAWYRTENEIGLAPRGQLVIALIHWHRGEEEIALRLLREYVRQEHAPGQAEYVNGVLERLDIRLHR